METLQILARHEGPRGEVVLRRRTGPSGSIEELIVNGTFAMDSAETSTERRLAELATGSGPRSVLVGGLGLGYTASKVLSGPVERVDVVELEESLVTWARAGITPTLAVVAGDPRVHLYAADVAQVLDGRGKEPRGPWDAIVLDVDNGPDFLIHDSNRGLYGPASLRAAYAQLTPGGMLAIWCQGQTLELLAELQRVAPTAREHAFQVSRGEREFSYAICTVTRPAEPNTPSAWAQ